MTMTLVNAKSSLPTDFDSLQDYAKISYDSYLSTAQKETFSKRLPSDLKAHLRDILLPSEASEDLETVKLILNIVEAYPSSIEGTGETFFLTLLRNPSDRINEYLEKLFKVVQSGLGEILFNCATTQKHTFYESQTLLNIILAFHDFIPHLPKPCPPLSNFPPYDQGGRELIASIKKTPKSLLALIDNKSVKKSTANSQAPLNIKTLRATCKDFSKMKSGAIQFLTSLNEHYRLKMEIYLDVFKEIQNGKANKSLRDSERRALLILIISTTTNESAPISVNYTKADLLELISEAQNSHEFCGEEVLVSFSNSVAREEKPSLDDVISVLKHLSKGFQILEKVVDYENLLNTFSKGKIKLSAVLKTLESASPQLQSEIKDKEDIESLYKRFAGNAKDPNVLYPLSTTLLGKIKAQYAIIQKLCNEWKKYRLSELVNLASAISLKSQKGKLTEEDMLKLVAIGRLAIFLKFKIYLYNTQVFTVLAELQFQEGAIAQVKTGEGKSMIVCLLAFVKAKMSIAQGHIISSARSLSTRDQIHFLDFFMTFGITTSHICEDNCEANRFEAKILYGTANDFEFAIMRELLYLRKLFPDDGIKSMNDKRFDWVIIDEVDNLTIDTALNGARLSSQAEVTYDWVYAPILRWVEANLKKNTPLDASINYLDSLKTFMKSYMNGAFASLVGELSDKRLMSWIKSAYRALYQYEEQIDYTIGPRETRNGDKVNGILIVDVENTGQIMHGSRWSNGVHEFVEIKHNLEVERENISPISMSHPVYYQMYKSIYGITGTIGAQSERDELKAIYNLDSFDVPTHNPPKRVDLPTLVFDTNETYLEAVVKEIKECVRKRRPILVLCDAIKETEILAAKLKTVDVSFEILNEVQKKKSTDIIEKAGLPGAITIATNTAGRGTDIKLNKESLATGGLHVLLTFYPDSERVEMQGRGRSGRQGQDGSSQIMLSKEKIVKAHPEAKEMDTKTIPEFLLQQRQKKGIVQKDIHVSYAAIERYCFEMVIAFYHQLNKLHELSLKDEFLDKLAKYFNKFKLAKTPDIDLEKLSTKNRLIAETALTLLMTYTDCQSGWKMLVKRVAERSRDAIINDFVLHFYSQVSEIIQESGITSYGERTQQLKKILNSSAIGRLFLQGTISELEKGIKEESEQVLESIKKELKGLFDQRQVVWGKYLDQNGNGIISYLSELTGIDLYPLETGGGNRKSSTQKIVTGQLRFDKDYHADEERAGIKPKNFEPSVPNDMARFASIFANAFQTGTPTEPSHNNSDLSFESFLKTSKTSWLDVEDGDLSLTEFKAGMKLPTPPSTGITIGLANYGNTCWLNSIVKFIASTTFYDQMLIDLPPSGKSKLQAVLREIVMMLRKGQQVPESFIRTLFKEITSAFPHIRWGVQQDAPELLLGITNLLKWHPVHVKGNDIEVINKSGAFPQLGIMYKPKSVMPSGWGKYAAINNFQTHVEVTIPAHFMGRELDLAQLIKDEGIRELAPDKLEASAKGKADNLKFLSSTHLLSLPRTIIIYVKRFFAASDGSSRQKIDFPIKLDMKGLITLTRFNPAFQNTHAVSFSPAETRQYRIEAAVIHSGDTEFGHYTCMERCSNGSIIEHNDTQVAPHSEVDYGKLGYFIRLKQV